jgi:hypothetical protein
MSESNCEQTNTVVNVARRGEGRDWEVKKNH